MSDSKSFDDVIREMSIDDDPKYLTQEFDPSYEQVDSWGNMIKVHGGGKITVEVSNKGEVGVSRDEDSLMTGFHRGTDPKKLVGQVISNIFFDLPIGPKGIPVNDIEDYTLDDKIYLSVDIDGSIYSNYTLESDTDIQGYKYISICVEVYHDGGQDYCDAYTSYTKVMRVPWANEPEDD